MKDKLFKTVTMIGGLAGILALVLYLLFPAAESPIARGYTTGVYKTDGGDTLVIADFGQLQVTPGATVAIGADMNLGGPLAVSAPTAIATATPALLVNNLGVSQLASIQDGGTEVLGIRNGGGVVVSAPTAIATAQPALVVNSDGLSRLVEVQDAATAVFAINDSGKALFGPSADADAANYDNMVYIGYSMTGTGTKDRNYGLVIEGQRPAGQEIRSGDHDEAGLKIAVDTHAVTTTAGTVLRAINAEAKADNPGGTVTNLFGASLTAKSDSNAGEVANMIALTTNSHANAQVIDSMMSADFRLFRQSATEPTAEYVIQVRNSSTTGSGADAAIYVASDYGDSATTDSVGYGIDFSGAAINTAEIRGENGETIANTTDTAWIIGGFVCATEGATIDLADGATITPVASYQPITNATGGSITTSATTAIADGPVAGAILILVNEDAQNIVIKDGANTILSGDLTLTGGANDTLTLIWNGADWVGISVIDN